jgi:hypothetical protein
MPLRVRSCWSIQLTSQINHRTARFKFEDNCPQMAVITRPRDLSPMLRIVVRGKLDSGPIKRLSAGRPCRLTSARLSRSRDVRISAHYGPQVGHCAMSVSCPQADSRHLAGTVVIPGAEPKHSARYKLRNLVPAKPSPARVHPAPKVRQIDRTAFRSKETNQPTCRRSSWNRVRSL